MACTEETKEINGASYYCRQWPASKSLLMKLKLINMFGASFAALAKLATDSREGALQDAVGSLFSQADPETVLAMMREVVSSATRDGERITNANFDDVYSDNLLEFYQAFAFVLGVNYASFFGGKLDLQSLLKKAGMDSSGGQSGTAQT